MRRPLTGYASTGEENGNASQIQYNNIRVGRVHETRTGFSLEMNTRIFALLLCKIGFNGASKQIWPLREGWHAKIN